MLSKDVVWDVEMLQDLHLCHGLLQKFVGDKDYMDNKSNESVTELDANKIPSDISVSSPLLLEHGVETGGVLPAFVGSLMSLRNTTDQVFEEMSIMMGVKESGVLGARCLNSCGDGLVKLQAWIHSNFSSGQTEQHVRLYRELVCCLREWLTRENMKFILLLHT